MTKNLEIKHHKSSAKIVGYGIADLISNYNVHTMNETDDRKNFVPTEINSLANVQDVIKGFTEKKKSVSKIVKKAKSSKKKAKK